MSPAASSLRSENVTLLPHFGGSRKMGPTDDSDADDNGPVEISGDALRCVCPM